MNDEEVAKIIKVVSDCITGIAEDDMFRTKEQNNAIDKVYSFAQHISEIVEKAIPKEPEKTIDRTWGIEKEVNVCPACGNYLSDIQFIASDYFVSSKDKKYVAYCEHCGQAVDYAKEQGVEDGEIHT